MATVDHKSGLSPNEREFLQDCGFVGRLNDSYRVYRHRIKHKIHPTLTDAILILEYAHEIELSEIIASTCKDDLLKLQDLITEYLKVTENSNPKTPNTNR